MEAEMKLGVYYSKGLKGVEGKGENQGRSMARGYYHVGSGDGSESMD
jgi:hypothetical protein